MPEDRLTRRELLAGAGALGVGALLPACDDDWTRAAEPELDAGPPALPPVTPNDDHYVTLCCSVPTLDAASWTLPLRDADGATLATVDLATLEALGPRDKTHTLECISAGPRLQKISTAVWTGLPLPEVLDALGVVVSGGTVAIAFEGHDDYTTAVPIADLASPLWLVWRMNGDPLPPVHGFPVRVLTPGRYGMKNPKWLRALSFVDVPVEGFWERQGWSADAPYLPNTLVRWPTAGANVRSGRIRAIGTAFAGRDPVVAVEVSVDGGPWRPARLDLPGGEDTWALWSFEVDVKPGDRRLQARCTTAGGVTSDVDAPSEGDLSGYGGSMSVAFRAV